MPRKPEHRTLESLIQYTILLYYQTVRERNPNIHLDPPRHLRAVNKIIKDYHDELERKYPDWNSEDNRELVGREIDFLTGIFSKQNAEKEKAKKLKELKEQVQKKARNIIW